MSDLVEFLLARIAEDEEVARAATPGAWEFCEVSDGWDGKTLALETVAKLPPYQDGSVSPVGHVLSGWGYDASGISVSDEDAAQIARWDPARVLAECDAKRRIVLGLRTGDPGNWWANEAWRQAEDDVLRLLALPYADHADYRDEWQP